MTQSSYTPTADEFTAFGRPWSRTTTLQELEATRTFRFKSTDVVVNTFPRTGTVITQEMVWHLIYGQRFPEERTRDINLRCPMLELNTDYYPGLPRAVDLLSAWPQDRGPRLIKTHCPFDMMQEALDAAGPRVIVNLRNPKDTAVSLFHFQRGLTKYEWKGEWSDFFEAFLHGWNPYGSFFTTVRDWWALRERPNYLFVRYEDLVRQPYQEVHRIAAHLGLGPVSEQRSREIVDAVSFRSMKSNPSVMRTDAVTGFNFIRKGSIGGWKDYFTVEQNRLMDDAVREHFGEDGPSFLYE